MQIIISPAKQMRVAADVFAPRGIPPFPHETARLHRALLVIERLEGPEGLQRLWKVSDRLLGDNLALLHRFVPVADPAGADDPAVAARLSPAAFSYVGIQYRSMAPEVMDGASLAWLQDHLWILSGLYGCARPFNGIEPYRLEMGARLAVDGQRDLYGFWGDRIARAVVAQDGETIVNLASVEYAKAVLPHLPSSVQVVTPIFAETVRDGKPVQRSTASKTARGSMVRWMAERQVEDMSDIGGFDVGYVRAPELDHERTVRSGAVERVLVFLNQKLAAAGE